MQYPLRGRRKVALCATHWRKDGLRIRAALKDGTYRPVAVRRVFIPKPDGTQRPLGVPTVLDCLIQQVLAQVLSPLFESGFSEHRYGFREGRNAHQAVRTMEAGWQEGRRHAVDCDLKAFFDTVNHERLMAQLRGKVRDRKVLALIRRYLGAGVMLSDGTLEATPQGVPQGGPLSPLLANIVLDPLDKELERRAHHFARYADDFIVMVRSPRSAERVKASLTRFAEEKLKLVINRAKSKAAPLQTCALPSPSAPPCGLAFGRLSRSARLLGFQIGKRGQVVWTQKVEARFKQRVRNITRRNRGHEVQDVIDELRRYVTGWVNYFGISHSYRAVEELADCRSGGHAACAPRRSLMAPCAVHWIRRRVRLHYWKQWKQPRTRRRRLIKLGADPEEVHMATRSRKGYWRMSANRIVQQALTNRHLEEQGVPNLRTLWIKIHYGPNARV